MNKIEDIIISDNAVKQITDVCQKRNVNLLLRINITGGGCSGFSCNFEFDSDIKENDVIFSKDTAKVIVNKKALPIIKGSEVDFKITPMSSFFYLNNPNAKSSCGCGESFSV